MEDLEKLVRSAAMGDQAAFCRMWDAVVLRLGVQVQGTLGFALRSDFGRDDLLQEVALQAWRGIKSFVWQGASAFWGWLFSIARHVAAARAKYLNAEVRKAAVDVTAIDPESGIDPIDPSLTLTSIARRRDDTDKLLRILAGLPEEPRLAFTLVYIEMHPIDEATAKLGTSRATLYRHLTRALQAVRKAFEK